IRLAVPPADDADAGRGPPLALGGRRQVSKAEQDNRRLGNWRTVTNLCPEAPITVTADHRKRHAGEEAAHRRFGRVEIGMGIEPDDPALRMVEGGEDAHADVARAGQYQGQLTQANRVLHRFLDFRVDDSRCARAVPKRLRIVDTHHGARHAGIPQQPFLPGVEITRWSITATLTL